jgi:hypothetical protein
MALKNHPIFVSVTEIEHNAKESRLEISCRIFTNDLENLLRNQNKMKLDLLHPSDKTLMNQLIKNYLSVHLKVWVNEKPVPIEYLGYEQDEEAVRVYLIGDDVKQVKSMKVEDTILYEYKSEQISLIHVTVNGERKSTKLNNPERSAIFNY